MKIKKEFNRLSGFLGDGLEKVHSVTDDFGEKMRDEAATAMKQARRSLHTRHRTFTSAEEVLERHLRDNAALYIVVGLALIGLFAVRVLVSEPPTDREW